MQFVAPLAWDGFCVNSCWDAFCVLASLEFFGQHMFEIYFACSPACGQHKLRYIVSSFAHVHHMNYIFGDIGELMGRGSVYKSWDILFPRSNWNSKLTSLDVSYFLADISGVNIHFVWSLAWDKTCFNTWWSNTSHARENTKVYQHLLTKTHPKPAGHKIHLNNSDQTHFKQARTRKASQHVLTKPIPCQWAHKINFNMYLKKTHPMKAN